MNLSKTGTDLPGIAEVLIGHCWQRDYGRDGAPVWITARLIMAASEIAKIPPMTCCGPEAVVLPASGHAVALRIGHSGGCAWLAALLRENIRQAEYLVAAAGITVDGAAVTAA